MAPKSTSTQSPPAVTVVIPTLSGGAELAQCLDSLARQVLTNFEVIVVDNSGRRLVEPRAGMRVIANDGNLGFGAAVNQAIRESKAPFIAALNDDTTVDPRWLESLIAAMNSRSDIGMCASQIRLASQDLLDSAGMLLGADGTSKQRGHLEKPEAYPRQEESLLPSGCAALYRREMLDEIGLFDETFFLYCEDTDLGLRARWAAWECLYVPDAKVWHRYSHSAGKASALKAYYVERNRLMLAVKNLPFRMLLAAPFYSLARYFWHALYAIGGLGKAAEFRSGGSALGLPFLALPFYVLRAGFALIPHLPRLWRERRRMKRRLNSTQFRRLVRAYSIGPRQVAAL
jgi:GT2 family glycosyltransferase